MVITPNNSGHTNRKYYNANGHAIIILDDEPRLMQVKSRNGAIEQECLHILQLYDRLLN